MMVSRTSPGRPSTPSFRILDVPTVNPSPTFTEPDFEDEEELFEDVLSPKKLRYITGHMDLSEVVTIELTVDTTDSSLGCFGNYLPNLRQLRLSGSRIPSIRDLGTSLKALQVLWMSRCGLKDLDGISSIGSLKELYLSYNEIEDVSPLSMVDSLELVDLESNLIESLEQVEFLCMCSSLTTLSLEGNPITTTLTTAEYRKELSTLLPSLKVLDDYELGGRGGELGTTSHPLLGNTGHLNSEIKVVQSSIRETMHDDRSRPKSAQSRARSPESPPSSRASTRQSEVVLADHSSDLTHGAVMCGPPSKMLTKMSRSAKEARSTSPPKLVSAWMEDGSNVEVIEEWKKDREWLTRELTICNDKELEETVNNQVNYEATLADFPQQRKLHRPTSGKSGKYRASPTQSIYDEAISAEDDRQQAILEEQPKDTHHTRDRVKISSREPRQRDNSQDRRGPRDGSRERRVRDGSTERSHRRGSYESSGSSNSSMKASRKIQRSPNIEKDSKVKYQEKAQVSKSLDQPNIAKVRTLMSNSYDSKNVARNSPIKATFRPQEADVILERFNPQMEMKRSLPTPPISPANTPTEGQPQPPGGGARNPSGGLSSRFRRLKVSVEDQVAHQATVDVLYSDKMPRPGLSRHTLAVPRPSGAQG